MERERERGGGGEIEMPNVCFSSIRPDIMSTSSDLMFDYMTSHIITYLRLNGEKHTLRSSHMGEGTYD